MRIRQLLTIAGTAGLASVIMVAVTIITLLVLAERRALDMRGLDEAVRRIALMRSLQPDFAQAEYPRAIRQWQAVYRDLGPILADIPAPPPPARTLKDDLLEQFSLMGSLMDRLARPTLLLESETREMIAAQLTVRSAAMVSDLLAIRDISDRAARRETQWLTVAVGASVAVLAGAILSLLRVLQRRIAEPVARLVAATGALSAGRLDVPVVVGGGDEIARLAESFDHMRLALRDRIGELGEASRRLEEANATLEQRVAERTSELQRAYTRIRDLDDSKTRFFANVSHELRTPLALILGPVDGLLAAAAPPETWRAGGRVAVDTAPAGGEVVVTIHDNGPGIPADLRDSIFERYVQGSDRHRGGGSGLGLAIAREFVAEHGGSIAIAPGRGAVFRIVLPLRAPEGTAVGEGEPLGGLVVLPEPAGGRTAVAEDASPGPEAPMVVVVEDNADLRAFIARALAGLARVMTAEDGAAGLAMIARVKPDLVVSDIMMPRLSGDRMVGEMRTRAELAEIPVLILSARADDRLRVTLLRGLVQDYLVKPFAAEELRARAANLLQVTRARELLRAELASRQANIETLARDMAEMNRKLRAVADDMRIAREAAEQASRSKSAFLNMVSHELRTPLTQVDLQLELLQRHFTGVLCPQQQEILSGLKAAMRRLGQLVVTVLDYSRIESRRLSIQPERFDLVALVAESCAAIETEAVRQGLHLSFTADDGPKSWVGDAALIRIAVGNLLDNALKYTRAGSISVTVAAANRSAVITVSDTGLGIPAASHQIIFEPFRHLEDIDRKHVPGMGLGLAIVRDIVDALGGRIDLMSEPGIGSRFSIELPPMEAAP